ncbi:MAG: hypothetical protein DIU67_009675 [Actinomycetes bacterium]|jgi:hypothetical protein|nr:MAG: hypothetical protein DIU67_08630 [Actinomycetota bacterium]
MMGLLRAEVRKLGRRKLYPGMVLILALFTLFAALVLVLFKQWFPEMADAMPDVVKPGAYEFGVTQVATQAWFPMLLTAVGLGAELSGTVWATALTRESSVVRHVLVRVAAYIGASWLGYIVAVAAWSGFVYFFADGSGGPELSVWLGIAWKLILVAAAWAALGLGAVSLIRSVGPAIGAVLGFYFLESFLSLWDPYETISATAASAALFGIDVPPMLEDFVPGAGMSVTHAALVLIGWTVVGTLLTWLGLGKRDA